MVDDEKMTLYEFAESVYYSLQNGDISLSDEALFIIQHHTFQEIVTNDDLCLDLIQATLEFKSVVFGENKNRASHILITWLLGIGFSRLSKLSGSIQGFEKENFNVLWLQTAMLHDYGYLRKEIKDEKLTLADITKNYDLLTDTYYEWPFRYLNNMSESQDYRHFFSYKYYEIEAYFDCSKEYHLEINDPIETNDHGIVGGCIAFQKYCERIKRNKSIESDLTTMLIQKIACYIAASHNIFKSSDTKTDRKYSRYGLYRLRSFEPAIVNETNSILLLLSLVDTIECTKRFSAKKNPKAYLIQSTTLKKVEVIVTDSSLIVDYSELYKYLENERKNYGMVDTLLKHVDGVLKISSWTSFATHGDINDFRVEITL